jgi:nucleolar protein 12
MTEHQAKLAEALARLPGDERKKIKAVDPDRLMRRAEKKKNKVLAERYERKQKNMGKAASVLGRETRHEVRARKEKKRVAAGNKTGKRAKI